MELLKERIRREGKVLPGNIIKVDGFLNHRVDTKLLEALADEFAKYFDISKITMVLTAEASGIALATICAQKYGVPMLFAKKAKSDNIEGGLYQSEVFSYTYKKKVTLIVSHEWLHADDHVLIIGHRRRGRKGLPGRRRQIPCLRRAVQGPRRHRAGRRERHSLP